MLDVIRRIIECVGAEITEAKLGHCAVIKYNHYYGGTIITLSTGEEKTIVSESSKI